MKKKEEIDQMSRILTLPEDLEQQVRQLHVSDERLFEIIKSGLKPDIQALKNRLKNTASKQTPKKSKWAKIAEKAHEESPLSGAGEYVEQCSRDFREDFAFKHDLD